MLLSGYQTAIQLAALAGFWSAYASHGIFPDSSQMQWRIPVAVQLLPALLLLCCIFAIPESPKFLLDNDFEPEATASIAWLRRVPLDHPCVDEDLNELWESSATVHAVHSQGTGFWRALHKKSVRRRLGVGIGLMIAQNMVGLNALNYCKIHTSATSLAPSHKAFL
jgi:hypothetical protein